MAAEKKLIAFIEDPSTKEQEREKAISELNLLGIGSARIEEMAYLHWQEFFSENLQQVLRDRIVVISHLLPDTLLNQCFSDVFEEYKQRKKDLGIDDIQKFWVP